MEILPWQSEERNAGNATGIRNTATSVWAAVVPLAFLIREINIICVRTVQSKGGD